MGKLSQRKITFFFFDLLTLLVYRKNPYVGVDETLRGRLEARLGKPNAECIIC